ncbi:hypothetical protein [Hydrotalea sp. AMD]|uniref:hypothetical protein n=1 Tax=Hydrotalea sp. AMD TaxID=2501297 RepID=UPI00257AF26E|nr:hypothetical protein [Hydrotalea sp. AMD]
MIDKVKILRANGNQIALLEIEINQYIQQGYQPHGELKILKVDRDEVLIQQMVLTTEQS